MNMLEGISQTVRRIFSTAECKSITIQFKLSPGESPLFDNGEKLYNELKEIAEEEALPPEIQVDINRVYGSAELGYGIEKTTAGFDLKIIINWPD